MNWKIIIWFYCTFTNRALVIIYWAYWTIISCWAEDLAVITRNARRCLLSCKTKLSNGAPDPDMATSQHVGLHTHQTPANHQTVKQTMLLLASTPLNQQACPKTKSRSKRRSCSCMFQLVAEFVEVWQLQWDRGVDYRQVVSHESHEGWVHGERNEMNWGQLTCLVVDLWIWEEGVVLLGNGCNDLRGVN